MKGVERGYNGRVIIGGRGHGTHYAGLASEPLAIESRNLINEVMDLEGLRTFRDLAEMFGLPRGVVSSARYGRARIRTQEKLNRQLGDFLRKADPDAYLRATGRSKEGKREEIAARLRSGNGDTSSPTEPIAWDLALSDEGLIPR